MWHNTKHLRSPVCPSMGIPGFCFFIPDFSPHLPYVVPSFSLNILKDGGFKQWATHSFIFPHRNLASVKHQFQTLFLTNEEAIFFLTLTAKIHPPICVFYKMIQHVLLSHLTLSVCFGLLPVTCLFHKLMGNRRMDKVSFESEGNKAIVELSGWYCSFIDQIMIKSLFSLGALEKSFYFSISVPFHPVSVLSIVSATLCGEHFYHKCLIPLWHELQKIN